MEQVQQSYIPPLNPSPSSPKLELNDKKFLTHFQQINTPIILPPNFATSQSIQIKKYQLSMSLYGSHISMIDKIADTPIDELHLNQPPSNDDILAITIISNLSPKIKQKLTNINNFFNQPHPEIKKNTTQNNQFGLNHYIQTIMNININNTSTPIQQPPPQQPPQPQKPKTKKIDLLIFEIINEKKRKTLISNFYKNMENKLSEFLDYILEDEPNYSGIPFLDKIKKVLKNLETFKGKIIDGELKVQMLRIFFQEFSQLKKQYQQQRRQNKLHHKPKTFITQFNKTKNPQPSTKINKNPIPTTTTIKNIQNKKNITNTKPEEQQNLWIGQLESSITEPNFT